jgi:hypothetical protein
VRCDAELCTSPNGTDDERQHIAATRTQGAIRIVACLDQGAAEIQHRGVAACGDAFGFAAVGVDKGGVHGKLSKFFARAVTPIRITPRLLSVYVFGFA